jgi:hypothetical protein
MNLRTIGLTLGSLFISGIAMADLEPWKDYDVSETVLSVSTIKVNANMDDAYLEGIRETWVKSNEVAKKLGQIVDYRIYRSDLPQSGDFNMVLIVELKSSADLGPNKARYDAFVKEMSRERLDENTEMAQRDYPAMREITGQYLLREVTIK